MIPADEAFEAWSSQDLTRMRAAMPVRTNPIDRHFLLMGIVGQCYVRRTDREMRALFLETARRHVNEFPSIAAPLAQDLGVLPRVPTFAQLATVLTEDGHFDEAVHVCEAAIRFGLHDGTKGDFAGRIARIRKTQGLSPGGV